MQKPTISVITVTYNAEKYLEKTFESVFAQTYYPYIEYIVIDGQSKDKTLEIIQKYASKISFWISEPDKGLYDAMNKAIGYAKGDYLLFMNAGDTFYENNTLEKVFGKAENADIYYGEAMMVEAQTYKPLGLRSEITPQKTPQKLTWKSLRLGMVVCHQTFIVKKTLAPLYDLQYKYSADVDWVIECLKRAKTIVHSQEIIANFSLGGLTTQKRKASLKERYQVLQKHYGFLPNLWNHWLILMRGVFFILKQRKKYWD
jgi:glycosyltransferase involved in cell wall biosynthesis